MSRPDQEDKHLAAFGKRVASIRVNRKMTQEQLADRTGLAYDTIRAIERGRRWARLTTLHIIAKGLGVKVDELFKGL